MANLDQKIRQEATSVLARIILFLVYYYGLIIVGIGLFVVAGWATWNILNLFFGLGVFDIRLVIFVGLAIAAMWLFCFQIGLYLTRPIFGIETKSDDFVKPEITREVCPDLFAIIEEIANATGNKLPKHVYLASEVNAYVSYDSSSIWSVFIPSGKNLTLGVGLLYGMNKSELKAIIGHEYGHFSQKTMRIGSLTYRLLLVIKDIIEFTEENQKEDAIARASADYKWYFHLSAYPIKYITGRTIAFYKYIEKKNRSLSRLMEYEADNVACQIAGSEAHVSALCKLNILASRYEIYENVIQSLLAGGHYINDFSNGYHYCFDKLSEDESMSISSNHILTTPVGDDYCIASRIRIIDGWNTHPTIEERIENAKSHKKNDYTIDTEDAGQLISKEILDSVGLSRQKEIAVNLELQYGWGSVKPMLLNEFKSWLLEALAIHRMPNYIFPFLNNTIVSFNLPEDEELLKENIISPFTDDNRQMLLEFAQADRDWDTLVAIHQSSEPVRFNYNTKEMDISSAIELHKAYLSSFNQSIEELDVKIYKYLWKNADDKNRLKNIYWLLFFSNAGLHAMSQIHDATENIFSTVKFYNDNGASISVKDDYLRQLSIEFRKVMADFDFENVSILCGNWAVEQGKSIDMLLNEWQDYLSEDCSSFDGTIYKVREVWSLLIRLFNFANNERKQRAICAYKGEIFEGDDVAIVPDGLPKQEN